MYEFIIFLRAIACALITNSHMEEVYPLRILANGGLLGDVIFFAVSGYCLYSLSPKPFVPWYGKRLKRIYPPMWLTTGTLIAFGYYGNVPLGRVFELMLYPTDHHFVASILALYTLFFFVMKWVGANHPQRMRYLCFFIAVIYFIVFYTIFDRSHYHIDDVHSKMIWPLFFSSMVIGMYFRIHEQEYLNKGGWMPWLGLSASTVLYFASKLAFSRGMLPPSTQWINQITLLVLLAFLFRCFIGIERKLADLPKALRAPVESIAAMAFELYLVQIAVILTFNTGVETFPRNFFTVIGVTVLFAWLVHHAAEIILCLTDKLFKKGVAKT